MCYHVIIYNIYHLITIWLHTQVTVIVHEHRPTLNYHKTGNSTNVYLLSLRQHKQHYQKGGLDRYHIMPDLAGVL